jgi:hypothetical protein
MSDKKLSPAVQNSQSGSPGQGIQDQQRKSDTPINSSQAFKPAAEPVKEIRPGGVDSQPLPRVTASPAAVTRDLRPTIGSLQTNVTAATIPPGKIDNLVPGSLPEAAIPAVQSQVNMEPAVVSIAQAKPVAPPLRGDKQSSSGNTANAVNRTASSSGVQATAPSSAKSSVQTQATPDNHAEQDALAHAGAQTILPSGAASQHTAQQSSAQAIAHPAPASIAQPALDSAGMRGAVSPTGPALNTAGAAAIPHAESRETFAALDAEPAGAPATWVHAGSNQAEAGFNDPNLGWVSVRADQAGGAIHATLVPGSSEAASALSSHLDGLNAYLDSRHSPVQSLTVGEPESRSSSWGTEAGMNQGTREGTQQGASQDSGGGYGQRSDSDSSFPVEPVTDTQRVSTAVSLQTGVLPELLPTADLTSEAHISVIA